MGDHQDSGELEKTLRGKRLRTLERPFRRYVIAVLNYPAAATFKRLDYTRRISCNTCKIPEKATSADTMELKRINIVDSNIIKQPCLNLLNSRSQNTSSINAQEHILPDIDETHTQTFCVGFQQPQRLINLIFSGFINKQGSLPKNRRISSSSCPKIHLIIIF